ncbi:MAG: hypothetical protein Q4C87_10765 [Actinomycetaceae bacterium]|nr:hypothetical protein [Actinomycetaceae bacterium]
MLTFTSLEGDDYDATPDQVPELIAQLVNASDEEPDVGFSWENIGVGLFQSNWLSIEDLEADTLEPHSFRAPDVETIIDIARLLEAGKIDEIMANYPWEKGYPKDDRPR